MAARAGARHHRRTWKPTAQQPTQPTDRMAHAERAPRAAAGRARSPPRRRLPAARPADGHPHLHGRRRRLVDGDRLADHVHRHPGRAADGRSSRAGCARSSGAARSSCSARRCTAVYRSRLPLRRDDWRELRIIWERIKAILVDRQTWKDLAYALLNLLTGDDRLHRRRHLLGDDARADLRADLVLGGLRRHRLRHRQLPRRRLGAGRRRVRARRPLAAADDPARPRLRARLRRRPRRRCSVPGSASSRSASSTSRRRAPARSTRRGSSSSGSSATCTTARRRGSSPSRWSSGAPSRSSRRARRPTPPSSCARRARRRSARSPSFATSRAGSGRRC